MSDDTTEQDNRDRSQVSASEDYEIEFLMSKHDISKNRVLELMRKHGGSRMKIEQELGGR
ncbi:MAG: DUF3606 domain-containing protein [Phyllobacterium sp.]|uniref:DUF3606 domain-containing protein n=1 Tax=Phyllobacterium sp. TaxID=1871046 RepID=UPI0030F283AD